MEINWRKRLEGASYPDLEAMMAAYAQAAVDVARREFGQELDYSSGSVDGLEAILEEIAASGSPGRTDADREFEVRLWGSYLGEVLRRRYLGEWEMTQYPGGVVAVPAIEVRGSRLFPLVKVYRRLTMGEEEALPMFFSMVTERLGAPAQIN